MNTSSERVFQYGLPFRFGLLLSALLCLFMAVVALILPWTKPFKPVEPSPNVTAILVSTLVFVPLTGYFITRCVRFWGRLVVDTDALTVRTLVSTIRVPFDRVVSLSIAGAEGGHEIMMLMEGRQREIEILTRHLKDEKRFMRLIRASLHDLIQRQNETWDQDKITCEFSPRAIREGWYFVAIVNCMAFVVAGSVIWSHYSRPMLVTIMIAGMVAILGLSVMVHQRHFGRRFTLTPRGLEIWSVLGNQFISHFSIQCIAFSHRQFQDARAIRCAIDSPEGRWVLNSAMRDFEGFVTRLARRAGQAKIRGSLVVEPSEQQRVLRVRAQNTMRLWFVASVLIGGLLILWGVGSLSQSWRLVKRGSPAAGEVVGKDRQFGKCVVTYEFSIPTAMGGQEIFEGLARVSERDFERVSVGDFVSVHYDAERPSYNVIDRDISAYFNWLFVIMGLVLLGYALYQMRALFRAYTSARKD